MPSDLFIGTLILASGLSLRQGRPKQLAVHRGTSLLGSAAENAVSLALGPVAVVLGAEAKAIRPALDGLNLILIDNESWQEGSASSLRTGMDELLLHAPELDGVLVIPYNQPLVSGEALLALVDAHRTTGKPIAAAECFGRLGLPAFFARSLFGSLTGLSGKESARTVLQEHRSNATGIPMPEASIDIDLMLNWPTKQPSRGLLPID